ncbi:thioredoxin-like protein 1 isoform X1 [Cyanistes caeruleus]|uniref:thioredoxin-like protein 1 isoform X1 n=1 Tax=Cyanistes caeruleus TaxID=156563 RepID=UPI000CDADEE8|nr:thioredoxin-like protein 1 isoform X1 [Cyanistes caeruleus]
MDFEEAERSEPTQALQLGPEDIREDGIIQLRYVKFQNVNSVTLFVQSNHGDEETTIISYFTFIGTPVQATNMNDFKRVSDPQTGTLSRNSRDLLRGSWEERREPLGIKASSRCEIPTFPTPG